jgi:hypothetical protein
MKIKADLYKGNGTLLNKEYPIKITITDTFEGKRRRMKISTPFSSSLKDWDEFKKLPKGSHPKFYTLHPYLLELQLKIDDIYRKGIVNFEKIKNILVKTSSQDDDLIKFGYALAEEKSFSTKGNYETALNNFKLSHPVIYFDDFDYSVLIKFKNSELEKGLRPVTVHTYLKNLRSIYNEYCRRSNKDSKEPFKGIFSGLNTRSSTAQRNYLETKQLHKLRTCELTGVKKLARDLWMLQFYLGGQDLKDIVLLQKKDIHKKRIQFKRKKLSNGYFLNNLIVNEARLIIDSLKGDHEINLFDYRTDEVGYKTFRRKIQRALIDVQEEKNIKLPSKSNLGIKTARHTFANFGKRLFIDPDLLRELMGHERNDIDNYYKDLYPDKVRDKAHKKIIKKDYKKEKKQSKKTTDKPAA